MQENVLSIATNCSILNINRLYTTFEQNILYKRKHISQTFQHCKYYISLLLIQNYGSFSSSLPMRPRAFSKKRDGASPQQCIWAMVTEKVPPSGTYHVGCIYVLQSRETGVHIKKKILAVLSCLFPNCRKHDFCSKRLTNEFALGIIFFAFKLEIIK